MKKLPLLFSLFMVLALVLAACGTNANNGVPTQDPLLVDPAPVDPVDPIDPALEPTATEMVVEEPVVEATETPVVDEMTETPVVDDTDEAVPVTGDADDYCYPNRLSHLIGSDLVDQNGNLIGEVEGVIVHRGQVTVMADDDVLDDDAEAGAVDPALQGNAGAASRIMYLLVDIEDDTELFEDDRDVLIPFAALQQLTLERQPLDVQDNCVFTLNHDVTVLQNAPYFEDDAWNDDLDLSIADWDLEYNTYWTEQGVVMNNTNAVEGEQVVTNTSNSVLLRDGFDIDVRNMEDDSLGEIVEFIYNPESGDFEYGILSRGGLLGLGDSYYPIPMDQLQWIYFADDLEDAFDIDDLGEFLLNVNEEEFEAVEGFDGLDDVDFTLDNWRTDADTFWMNRTPSTIDN
jgi:hypothetical protein